MPDMFVMPFRPAYDSNGRFAPGAQAWFTLSETNTPTPVYVDEALTTQQPNPLIADGLGKFARSYLDPGIEYRLRVYVAESEVGVDDPLTDHDYDPYVPSDQGAVGPRGENAIILDDEVPVTTGAPGTPASATNTYLGLGTYQLSFTIPQGAAGSSGALADGVYGDITVSGGGTNLQITAGAITVADMGNIAANSLLGNTGALGAVEVLSVAQVTSMLGIGATALLGEATVAQYRQNTADKVLTTDIVWSAADTVTLTAVSNNVAVDMDDGFNFTLTMGGAYTLSNPTNTKNGQAGLIYIVQDGTGSRTLAFGTYWKFEGGTDPVLSTAAGSVDVLQYQVRNSTFIVCSLGKGFG